jgi:hypothetical protein
MNNVKRKSALHAKDAEIFLTIFQAILNGFRLLLPEVKTSSHSNIREALSHQYVQETAFSF